ncbi:unnamed protein product [Urochloa humidicola]
MQSRRPPPLPAGVAAVAHVPRCSCPPARRPHARHCAALAGLPHVAPPAAAAHQPDAPPPILLAGSVFTLCIPNHKITFLIGPEVSDRFFNGHESELSQQEVYRFTVAAFGPGVAFDVKYSVRLEQIRIFADALRGNKLRSYVGQMVSEAEEYFSKWGESGTVDLKYELEQIILLITSRCLLGREVRENLFNDVATLFHDLCNGMQPVSVIFPYLPIPAHRRRDRARARLGEMFSAIIKSRKASGQSEEDMLQCLIDYKYKDGRPTTDGEITGLLITVLFGGQQTSSITSVGVYRLCAAHVV